MLEKIKEAINCLDELSQKKKFKIISHFDTDGITSAAIFSRALKRWGKGFSLKIVKSLDEETIQELGEEEILIFLDLASGSLEYLAKKKTEVFVFDHHELSDGDKTKIPENVFMVNPVLHNCEAMSAAAICYLFAKELSIENKDLAKLAVIGMVGDLHEKNISKAFGEILSDAETIVKKGVLIYPSTRPLDKALEYSSNPYIPSVSGSRTGVIELLRDAGLSIDNGKYKALYELNKEEMTNLVTAIMLRGQKGGGEERLIGNLFLVKFFNKLEDARELSALINACSRMDYPEVALGFCLGNRKLKEEAEKIYLNYKQSLVSALKYVSETSKLEGKNYMIINARDKIKDTIIGTIASILSHSPLYQEGLVIVALSYNENMIKVSARLAGRKGRNVRELLYKAVVPIGGEVGGHPQAAGCMISREKEGEFIGELKKVLELEVVKV
ncbi:MAG: DHH family phosphoesterase [Nanoarchaeota archaeon]|nr:DHH family phosphoesterase [Nanoarchaeota archaeon]MBU1052172.1 DHH family phosphoesterase [Nanoarchaeota archaeon]MBU1988585.1 DHH family phosphoesterase [Nanoarchaeota archaeon]